MGYIGCAGWSLPRPFQSEFPEGSSHLERYAQIFSCVEINSSFYRSHKETTWRRWAAAVPAHFRFSVKAPRAITHDRALECGEEPILAFVREVNQLGEKLGAILVQTPPKLEFSELVVDRFFASLRANYSGQVALEPRHASWFTTAANRLMTNFDVARVAADPSWEAEGAHPGGSSSFVYYRLHGTPRKYYSAYSHERLKELAKSLQSGPEGWCIFDNTASGAATRNALDLKKLVSEP